MKKLFGRHKLVLLLVFNLVLYLTSIFLSSAGASSYRFGAFYIYILNVGLIFVFFLWENIKRLSKKAALGEFYLSALLVSAAAFVSFVLLKQYPYVSVGDEVRDSGLDAIRLINGQIGNIFSYGNYDGYVNIIPAIAGFFYRLFGASVYTFRVPAALASVADICLMYLLLRLAKTGKAVSFIGSLSYGLLPMHLFYARTEFVVILDSLWTTMILTALYLWIRSKNEINYIFLGTVLGVGANLHSPVRIVSLAVAAIVILLSLKPVIGNLGKTIGVVFLFLYFLIGFGPTLIYSGTNTFFQTDKLFMQEAGKSSTLSQGFQLPALKNNYAKSLMVWFYEPTTSHFAAGTPLLPPLWGVFFVLGIGYAVFVSKTTFDYILIFFVFALPFANSAITNAVNADHRLMSMLPVGAFLTSAGIRGVYSLLKRNYKYIFLGLLGLYALFVGVSFFYSGLAVKNKNAGDFLSMHIIYTIKSFAFDSESGSGNICLDVSQKNYGYFDLQHYKEQYRYFLPRYIVELRPNEKIADNEAYIRKGGCLSGEAVQPRVNNIFCEGKVNFLCPPSYKGSFRIYY